MYQDPMNNPVVTMPARLQGPITHVAADANAGTAAVAEICRYQLPLTLPLQ